MRPVLPMLGLVLLLAACKPAADVTSTTGATPDAAAAPDQPRSNPSAPATSGDKAPPPSPQAPKLAMVYHYGLALPATQVAPLMESHQEACERAGTEQCQVLGAEAHTEGRDQARATLTIRATPAWVRLFRGRAEADVKGLGGRVLDTATTGEDLSAPIVDAQAAQRARAAETARLQGLMKRRTKSLNDTLAVEQEITRVQGESDQARSELAMMNNRVLMQTITVDYQSLEGFIGDGATAPVAQAGHAFVGHLMSVFAALLTLASYLLPFALIGAPLVWLFARQGKKPVAPETPNS